MERTLELAEDQMKDLEARIEATKAALRDLFTVSIYGEAPPMDKSSEMYEEGDEKASFFTEAYLYNLIGKDAARTVLALIHKVEEPLNMRDGSLFLGGWRAYKDREERKRR